MNTKKAILDYIEEVKNKEKLGVDEEILKNDYILIAEAIEKMKEKVKANTTAYLQNQLKNALGKYQPIQEEETNYFIEFFKEAYPEGKRRKDFTWVMVDHTKISIEQILHTLKYINGYCLKQRLPKEAKKDILPMIEKLAKTDSLKHINQVRSMEGIRKALRIKIVTTPQGHKIVSI